MVGNRHVVFVSSGLIKNFCLILPYGREERSVFNAGLPARYSSYGALIPDAETKKQEGSGHADQKTDANIKLCGAVAACPVDDDRD